MRPHPVHLRAIYMYSPISLKRLGLYWRTLRYLRPIQFYGRLWFKIYRPKPNFAPCPALREPSGEWVSPARRRPSMTGENEFRFLNKDGSIGADGWNNPERTKLWVYNQHYFDDLNATDATQRRAWHIKLLDQWIAGNRVGHGSGWEPYPISLRIVNLIKWALAGNSLSPKQRHNLAIQTRWLTRRLEWHLLGNHLFANAKALVFAGSFFEGPEAEKWLRRGASILRREIPEQILLDGGQFELSTMYHALAVEDMLDIVNVLNWSGQLPDIRNEAASRVPAMLDWLQNMSHPDGAIAFFNDSAFGISPSNEELFALAERLGMKPSVKKSSSVFLKSSGYARLEFGPIVVIVDLAAVGPDYLPGHAHADTLSCEISAFGQRVIVNSGTSEYGSSPERDRQRSTAAHSTVTVDNRDSSEVWGAFRVARRARVAHREVYLSDKICTVSASHDGYTRLPDGPVHKREWRLENEGLLICDTLSTKSHEAVARYIIHPDVNIDIVENVVTLELPSGQKLNVNPQGGDVRIEPTTWSSGFGISNSTQCLCVPLVNSSCSLSLTWSKSE